MSSKLSLSNMIRASEQASHTWKHKGSLYYNPSRRKYHSKQKLEYCFPKWQQKSHNLSAPLAGYRWEENFLGMLPPTTLHWVWTLSDSSHIYRKPGECGLHCLDTRQRYLAKNDKGGTCIRRKALYLMLQMWSQAPKPTKERIYRDQRIPPGLPFVPPSC